MKNNIEVLAASDSFVSKYSQKRDCFSILMQYLLNDAYQDKVCALYGLRRTGKTVLMHQCASKLPNKEKERAVIINCYTNSDFSDVYSCIKERLDQGCKYFFIDEITNAENFQNVAESLANSFVNHYGARIIVTGTDSLGLALSSRRSAYDRFLFVPTTYTPFAEYSRLIGCESLDEYIRHGSTLKTDVYDNITSTREYVETAIVDNILKSLEKSEAFNTFFPVLTELYDSGALKSTIERLINAYSQTVTLKALRRPFVPTAASASLNNILKASENSEDIKSCLKWPQLCGNVAKSLRIIENDKLLTQLKPEHIEDIHKFLKDIDVVTEIPIVRSTSTTKPSIESLKMLTHPGMYHANIHYTLDELSKQDNWFVENVVSQKNRILEQTYNFAAGTIMENVIVSDVSKLLCKSGENAYNSLFLNTENRYFVAKLQFQDSQNKLHEADLIVFDKQNKECWIFEIKHSNKYVEEQSMHLEHEEFLKHITDNFGSIKGKAVLYNGETNLTHDIPRISAKDFLIASYECRNDKEISFDKIFSTLTDQKPELIHTKRHMIPDALTFCQLHAVKKTLKHL